MEGAAEVAMAGGKKNAWLSHVKKTMKSHKGQSFKAILKAAKKSYKGGAALSPADVSAPAKGGRRRSRKDSKKTRRSRK